MDTRQGAQQRQELLERDLAFMADPQSWPAYPYLPLIRNRPHDFPEMGVLFDAKERLGRDDLQTTVFLCNLLDLGDSVKTWDQFLALGQLTFPSHQAILEAGWRIN